MPDVEVAVPFAKQETLYYCGPATMQMVLGALGVASPAGASSWQDQLWDAVQLSTGATRPANAPSTPTSPAFSTQKCEWCSGGWKCWSTTPAVMESLLNSMQGVVQYAITTHASEASATDALLDAIDLNLPAVALVRGWQHWLVVDGYRHGGANGWAVSGRAVNGVYLRDSLVQATHYVSTRAWRKDYLKFIPCGAYQNTFLVLGGVRRSAAVPVQSPQRAQPVVSITPVRSRPESTNMKRLLPADVAIRKAREAARELAGPGRLAVAFREARPRKAQLVQRLDDADRYYYIVGFVTAGRETGRVIVDGFDGEFLEASGIKRKGQTMPPMATSRTALERLSRESAGDSSRHRFRIRAGMVGQHPVMVWKPCGQSPSPFMPFHQFSVGDTFVYVRADGERFDELTEGPA